MSEMKSFTFIFIISQQSKVLWDHAANGRSPLWDRLEQFNDRQALSAFADRSEPSIDPWEDLDAMDIGHKQCQAGSAREPVCGDFDAADLLFLFAIGFILVSFKNYNRKLNNGEELFLLRNPSVHI